MSATTADQIASLDDSTDYEHDAWARFLARMVDIQIVVLPLLLVIAFGVGVVHALSPIPAIDTYLAMTGWPRVLIDTGLMWAVSLVAESLMISAFAGTPGKALMGVAVRTAEGAKLSVRTAALRWLMVLAMGRGLGAPLLGLITLVYAYRDVEETGTTAWDDMLDVNVTRKRVAWWRWALAILISACLIGLNAAAMFARLQDLTGS